MEEDLQLINDFVVAMTDFGKACIEPASSKVAFFILLLLAVYGALQRSKPTFGCFFLWRASQKNLDALLDDKRLDRLARIYKRELKNVDGVEVAQESANVVFNLKSVARAYSVHVLADAPIAESVSKHILFDLKHEIKSGLSFKILLVGFVGTILAVGHGFFVSGSVGLPPFSPLFLSLIIIIDWISSKEIIAMLFIYLLQQFIKKQDSVYLKK